jgi:hypothetical protein
MLWLGYTIYYVCLKLCLAVGHSSDGICLSGTNAMKQIPYDELYCQQLSYTATYSVKRLHGGQKP